jgi:L-asparagine permease
LPEKAFDIATTVAGLGVIVIWVAFLVAQLRLRSMALRGELERPGFRMPGAPYTNYLTIGFLALVVVLLGFSDDIAGQVAFYSIPVLAVILGAGWFAVRKRSAETMRESDPSTSG